MLGSHGLSISYAVLQGSTSLERALRWGEMETERRNLTDFGSKTSFVFYSYPGRREVTRGGGAVRRFDTFVGNLGRLKRPTF